MMATKDLERTYKTGKAKMHSSELVPVHVTVDELIAYNQLQKTPENPTGQYVDKKTGLREYSRLSNILRIPEIRDLFLDTVDTLKAGQEIPEEIQGMVSAYHEAENPQLPPIPSDNDPKVQQYEEAGLGDDKKMALFPLDVVHFLSILQEGSDPDSEFGLPQFGNAMKSVVRVAATVAGGVIGFTLMGPAGGMMGASLGAGAGAYVGNAAGRMLTGQKPGDAMAAAAPNAMYGAAAGAGASYMGLGAAGAGAATAPAVAAAPAAAPAAVLPGTVAAAPAVAPVAAAPTGFMGHASALYEGAKPYLIPAGIMGGAMMMGKKGDEQQQKAYEKEQAKAEEQMNSQRNYFNSYPTSHMKLKSHPSAPADQTYGRPRKNHYKKGGVVKDISTKGIALEGKGDGQSDSIKQHIPEYTWIHDASTVSNLGNGTTSEGHKILEKFEKKIEKKLLPLYKDELIDQIKTNKLRKVPCRVANGERETPPLLVGALGKGSFEEGASVLRKITREIRQHKTSKRNELPPTAHAMETYYKKALGRNK